MKKDTNFGNAIIHRQFGTEKRQKPDTERQKFQERHDSSTPWAREMPKILPRNTRILAMP